LRSEIQPENPKAMRTAPKLECDDVNSVTIRATSDEPAQQRKAGCVPHVLAGVQSGKVLPLSLWLSTIWEGVPQSLAKPEWGPE